MNLSAAVSRAIDALESEHARTLNASIVTERVMQSHLTGVREIVHGIAAERLAAAYDPVLQANPSRSWH